MTPAKFKKAFYDLLLSKIKAILKESSSTVDKLKTISMLLKDSVPHYSWVGFYLVDKETKRELILGPFAGEPTEHVRIPFGRGICGQAAERRETFLVQDVSKETNYLSCNPKVKSEIVVPIFRNDEMVGELDIDSHKISPFTEEDDFFLKKICEAVSTLF